MIHRTVATPQTGVRANRLSDVVLGPLNRIRKCGALGQLRGNSGRVRTASPVRVTRIDVRCGVLKEAASALVQTNLQIDSVEVESTLFAKFSGIP